MSPKKTSQINFRIPVDLLAWLDEYAAYLTELGGTPVARTQALLKLVAMAKPSEDQKMAFHKYNEKMTTENRFNSVSEFSTFLTGVDALYLRKSGTGVIECDQSVDERDAFLTSMMNNPEQRQNAIIAGLTYQLDRQKMLVIQQQFEYEHLKKQNQ